MKLLILIIIIGVVIHWRRDKGKPHSPYFLRLQELLQKNQVSHPRLVIDLDRLDLNINRVKQHVGDTSCIRIVAKSLPCFQLLQYLQEQLNTNRLMVFHQPFLVQQLARFPEADILIGKPLPVAAVRKTLELSPQYMKWGSERLKWLVDSVHRLEQYLELAREKQIQLRVSCEIDIGLHRGGLESCEDLRQMLQLISDHEENLAFTGFVGYEPHIGKIPGVLKFQRAPVRDQALSQYQSFVELVREEFPALWHQGLCLNAGGSMTYQLYPETDRGAINELALGSAFMQPSDFDLYGLQDHLPAAYITAPVLKVMNRVQFPALEFLNGVWEKLTPNLARSFCIYGGWWRALPVSPKGLSTNFVFGRSANQELFTGAASTGLEVDDFVFLRPTQSEAVLLQFGRILIVRRDRIIDEWDTFRQDY